jgi:ATP-dependent protease HslVU (ClpYQ) peptidase subunit
MSTVAWDGKTLAADRQRTMGGTPIAFEKTFTMHMRGGEYHFAMTGSVQNANKFKEWVIRGMNPNLKPALTDEFSAIMVNQSADKSVSAVLYEADLIATPLERGNWAMGSGADFALGAMAMGADAVKAVEIAIELDVHSGIGITAVEVAKP